MILPEVINDWDRFYFNKGKHIKLLKTMTQEAFTIGEPDLIAK